MHKQPPPENLLATVGEYLDDLRGRVDAGDQFRLRVSVHLLGIAERQLARGDEVDARERQALTALLGEGGSLEDLNRKLCSRIRAGGFDDRWDELLVTLNGIVADEVNIVAPGKQEKGRLSP